MSPSARPKREERVTIDNFFLGGLGGLPPGQRAQPFALKHFFFALCKFYRFSIGVL